MICKVVRSHCGPPRDGSRAAVFDGHQHNAFRKDRERGDSEGAPAIPAILLRLGCRTDICGLFEEAAKVVIEIVFLVDEAPEGGFTARAVGESIFTEADSIDELRVNVRSAVDCHFDDGQGPKVIRLHIVRNS